MKLKTKGAEEEIVDIAEFIGVKGVKAKGKRLTSYAVKKVAWIEHEAEPDDIEEPDEPDETEDDTITDENEVIPVAKDDGQMELPL